MVLGVVSGVSAEMIAASYNQVIPTATGNTIPGYIQNLLWFTAVLLPVGEISYQAKQFFQFKKTQNREKTFNRVRGLRDNGRGNAVHR